MKATDGEIPKNCVLIFKDGNRKNVSLDSRKTLAWIQNANYDLINGIWHK